MRAAAHRVDFPHLDQFLRRPETGILERVGVVAPLHAAAGTGVHEGAAELCCRHREG